MKANGEIPRDECWRLLATASIGRIALSMKALPTIVPVQYHLDEDQIYVCLGSFRVPEQAAHGAVVAFSVDDIDLSDGGWAIQAVGKATFEYHKRTGAASRCRDRTEGRIVRIEPNVLSGQWLDRCPFTSFSDGWDSPAQEN